MKTIPRPIFFLFLVLGPFVVLPYLILSPARVTLSAAWRKTPTLYWRIAVCLSVFTAMVITCPASPVFLGFNVPFTISAFGSANAGMEPLWSVIVWPQLLLLNASLIGLVVCLPVSAASTIHTHMKRKREMYSERLQDAGA